MARIERSADGYHIQLEDGARVDARRVVLAVGISHFAYVPDSLSHLPEQLLTHSSAHHDCSVFRDKKVTIVGAGASAIDLATLMHESGVDVSLVARSPVVRFHNKPGPAPRSLWQRMRNPSSGLGPGWKSRFYTDAPGIFRYFPEELRLRIVENHLGPAPGWPMKERVQGKVPMLLGFTIAQAIASNGGVRLSLRSGDGKVREHDTEHVVAATGYKPDIRRLDFLDEAIRNEVRSGRKCAETVGGLSIVCAWTLSCRDRGGKQLWPHDAICLWLRLHCSPHCRSSSKTIERKIERPAPQGAGLSKQNGQIKCPDSSRRAHCLQ